MRIAFLYNVRHTYPDANDPRSQLETDFDDQVTIDALVSHFIQCGYDVLPVEANEDAYTTLNKNKNTIDLVFNYAEGMYGEDRQAHVPAMCEMLQIPYTHSTPLTQALCLNKARLQDILRAFNLPNLPYLLFSNSNNITIEQFNSLFKFPVIVKPVSQGSSAGITNKSIVRNLTELKTQIDFVTSTFAQEAMVTQYLTGREFSIGLLGNPPQVLPFIEPDHSLLPNNYEKIDSLEVKWFYEDEVKAQGKRYLTCPAIVDTELKNKIDKLCVATWNALQIRDVCRMDVRCDENNNPYVIDVNTPPGMILPEITDSYLVVQAKAAGISYDELIRKIIQSAVDRYK